jgi:hypothetical protein
VIVTADQLAQRVEVPNLNLTAPDGNKSFPTEFGKDSTYGLQREPQKTADLCACHPEHEIRPRAAVGQKPLRQIDYEYRDAFLGTPVTEEQHCAMVAANVVTQGTKDVRLKRFAIVVQPNEIGARHDADFALAQRDRIAAILAAADPIQPKEIPGHLKASYLTDAVFGKHRRLETSSTDRINRIALRARSIQHLILLNVPAIADERRRELSVVMRTTAQTNFLKLA